MLKIEDLKVGDELVCADFVGFSKVWKDGTGYEIKKIENVSILHIYQHSFSLKGIFLIGDNTVDKIYPSLEELKYFKKKEQHIFDDLANITFQAWKDGLLKEVNLGEKSIEGTLPDGADIKCFSTGKKVCNKLITERIEFIKSLYKGFFVIDSVEDIEKIKIGALIHLLNGNTIEVMFNNGVKVKSSYSADEMSLVSLKGATVEQERGRDE